MGLLASAGGGLGEGLMVAGKMLGDYASKSALQQEMADIMKERDARVEEFTAGESAKNREHASTLQAGAFTHAENLQDAGFAHAEELQRQLKDFQTSQHGLDREQRLQLHKQTMAQLEAQFKNQGLTLQADKDGNIGVADMKGKTFTLLQGADGQPVKSSKSEDSIKLIEALGHAMKSIDPMDTSPGAKDLRDRLGSALLITLGGKVGGAPAAPSNRPPLESFAKGGSVTPKTAPGLLNSGADDTPAWQKYIVQRRGGVYIDAPARSQYARFNGRTFGSHEDAARELGAFEGYQE